MNYYLAVLNKYATFKGRARRKEYWYFVLFNFLIILALPFISTITGVVEATGGDFISVVYKFIMFIPSIAVGIRRMHDVNKSGWFFFIPIYNFILAVTDGTKGSNKHGPDPKK